MQKLTRAEEEIMYHIWDNGPCTVTQILELFGEKKPPHSTISSIVRILEKKGFVDHKAYGRTYEYFAVISKKDYSKKSIKSLITNYFDGSVNSLVSFLVKEKDLSIDELGELIDKLEKEEDND